MSRFPRAATSALTLVLALVASLVFVPAAGASSRPIDITGYTVSDQVISSTKCRYVTVKMTTKKQKDYASSDIDVDVTKGRDLVDSLWSENGKTLNRLLLCPWTGDFGKYTVGPADVFAEYTYHDRYIGKTTGYRNYLDGTKKSFYVRSKSLASTSATRRGKTVTLKVSAKVFSPSNFGYRAYNAKSAKLQVKSGKSWKTVKTVRLSHGKATATVRTSVKKQYRFTFPKTTTATGATSKVVTK